MKKLLIPVLLILTLLIGFIIYAVSYNFNRVQYEKDVLSHLMNLQEGGQLTAQYNGQTTLVLGNNVVRIQKVLGVSDRRKLYLKPDYDEDEAIVLDFSDGAQYIIAVDESMHDAVFIKYSYRNKETWYRVDGYNSFGWAQRAISPEGITSENQVIE